MATADDPSPGQTDDEAGGAGGGGGGGESLFTLILALVMTP